VPQYAAGSGLPLKASSWVGGAIVRRGPVERASA